MLEHNVREVTKEQKGGTSSLVNVQFSQFDVIK